MTMHELDVNEALGKLTNVLNNPHLFYDTNDTQQNNTILSLLPFLYTQTVQSLSSIEEKKVIVEEDDELYTEGLDVEGIYAQVETLTKIAEKLVKSKVRKLEKSDEKPKLLDTGADEESEDDTSSETESDDSDEGTSDDGNDSDDEDEDRRRMEERMKRVMADMADMEDAENNSSDEGSSSNDSVENVSVKYSKVKSQREEDVEDPAAVELNDGFFNLHELEEFADEEEAIHYGITPEMLYEMKNNNDNEDSEDDDEDDSDMEDEENKDGPDGGDGLKYREDDEIAALHSMYSSSSKNRGSTDVAKMSAADYFGMPDRKNYEKYYKKKLVDMQKKSVTWEEGDNFDEFPDDDDCEDDEYDGGIVFGKPASSVNKEDEEEDSGDEEMEEDEEEEQAIEEDFEKGSKILKLKNKKDDKDAEYVAQLEDEAMAEKPWKMRGETSSKERPVNSLLEVNPEFEHASKIAPAITVEHTENLEEIIKRRILDEDWDDVIPRELPDINGKLSKELPEVSQEKSKLGLGELYEREYIKKATGFDVEAAEKETEEDKAKSEMRALFANLCSKLDALSNYHFAPRPVAPEAEVSTSLPAITMEEVLPVNVTNAQTAAPEEVFQKKHGRDGVLYGDSERDQAERKRKRNAKKAARRKARKEQQADEKLISRLQPGNGLNNPYEKRKMREELAMARGRGKLVNGEKDTRSKEYSTSTKFFEKLQREAEGAIDLDRVSKKRKVDENVGSSRSFKL